MENLRSLLKKSDAVRGAVFDFRKIALSARRNDRLRRIADYMGANAVRKLQIGSGPTLKQGWLCTDIAPKSPEVMFLDATKRFPFDDGSLDYIYSEHMIEHISWESASFMLKEVFRVLKPDGFVRTATPDMQVIVDLLRQPASPEGQRYVEWILDNHMKGVASHLPQFAVNCIFHSWGHTFIYDEVTLRLALERAGFVDIERCTYGQSAHAELNDIESHGNNVDVEEMAIFETMIFEARRPRPNEAH